MSMDKLPPLPILPPGHWPDNDWTDEDMHSYAQAARTPLLAKLKDQALEYISLFDQCSAAIDRAEKAERELSHTQSDRQREHERRVTAEGTVEELRARLEAIYAQPARWIMTDYGADELALELIERPRRPE